MGLDENDELIRKACFDLAINVMWEKDSLKVEQIEQNMEELSEITEEFFRIAKVQHSIVDEDSYPIDMLIRAIEYMSHVHAIPPCRGQYGWFDDGLRVLLELTSPNCIHTKGTLAYQFLEDIENGIKQSRDDTYED